MLLFEPTHFRELVRGERTGLGAMFLRGALWGASIPYGWAVGWRNYRYNRGRAPLYRAAVPVISIGNLTVGGTGKTPMVEWTCRRLRGLGVRTAILSRGYGAPEGSLNDEALELEWALPDVPHLQDADRSASAEIAVEELAMQALVLDDGFQHRRLVRDVDIVLLDATEPFGYDRLLPRGTLRESLAGLRRAHMAVLTRADMLDREAREAIRRRVAEIASHVGWCEVVHRPQALVDAQGGAYPLETLRGKRVGVFCGIGNPSGFHHTLTQLGAEVCWRREFPDHHNYQRADVQALTSALAEAKVELAVCTRKDLVKLQVAKLGEIPLRAIAIEIEFTSGEEGLVALIDRMAQQALSLSAEEARESD